MSLAIFQGPLSMTAYVLENVMLRQYASGGQYGTTFCTTSQDIKKITPIIVNKKNLTIVKEDKSFLHLEYLVLQDGIVKIGKQIVVSIQF